MMSSLGEELIELEECLSTNDHAAELARTGAEHGTVVVANSQSRGRGRLGRKWVSHSRDNLYMSVVLRPEREVAAALPLAAGIAVADAVCACGAAARLKWPNDVLIGSRKVAGILCEMSTEMRRSGPVVDFVILGVGVNLNQQVWPQSLQGTAISVVEATGKKIDPTYFRGLLLGELGTWLPRFWGGGVAAIREPWLERAAHLNGRVAVTSGGVSLWAYLRDLDHDGALIVEDLAGKRHRVLAGDIVIGGCAP